MLLERKSPKLFKRSIKLNFSNVINFEKKINFRISAATTSLVNTIISPFKPVRPHQLNLNRNLSLDDPAEMKKILDSPVLHTPSDKWNFNVEQSPLMSPFYADEEILRQFPPTRIVVRLLFNIIH